jgi:adenylate cyclase
VTVPENGRKRRLAAILSVDVVGYSRLMQDDEHATVDLLQSYRTEITRVVESHEGRVVNTPGDSILAELPSAVEALAAAVEVQSVVEARNLPLPDPRRMHLRIGVNLGDVLVEPDGTVYGDGVNIAARMEALAKPGGIVVSATVHEHVRGKIDVGFDDLGQQAVKNIAEPIHAYAVLVDGVRAAHHAERVPRKMGVGVLLFAGLVLFGAGWGLITILSADRAIEIAAEDQRVLAPADVDKMAYALPQEPSIAVLPFDNLSGDPEHGFIADGLTENIIAMLARASDIMVIARNSTFIYKGRAVDIRQVAEEQSVRYVLEGSIQVFGETMRVTAQLIDAVDGLHVWADRYERPLTDLFAVQDEITLEIVRAMQVELVSGESALTLSAGSTNLEAWIEMQKAAALIYQFSPQTNLRARKGMERVLELDPESAPAMVWLGWTYSWSARAFGSQSYDADLARSMELAEEAMALDPTLPEAYSLLAMGQHAIGLSEEALANADAAVALAPNRGNTLLTAAAVNNYAGRFDRAHALIERAERLTPVPDVLLLLARAFIFNALGNFEAAEVYARRVIEKLPTEHNYGHEELLYALVKSEKLDEARELAKTLVTVNPEFSIASHRDARVRCCNPSQQWLEDRADAFKKAGVPD